MTNQDPAPESASPPGHKGNDSSPLIHLATAIVEQRAMVYVGAGASVPSGGPLWSELLEWLCEKGAEPMLKGSESFKYLKSRLENDKKYLEAADLLQDILDNDLPRFLREKFAKVSQPSSIHVNVGRIPFKVSITTNYDDLLELAYGNSISGQDRPYVLTWNNPKDILQAVQDNIRFVLKTHGKVDDGSSLILSSRQYRNLIFASPLYWQIVKWLFMTKTCLFVGCSLTDPDLLHVFEEAITESGDNFGPHYALLPKDEAPEIKVQNLWGRLRVKVIALEPGEFDKPDKNDDGDPKSWVEAACSRVLVDLAGEVAKQTVATRPPALPTSDDREFFLIKALEKLLQTALEVTGSFRGDICLPSDVIGGREAADLHYRVSQGPTDPKLKKMMRVDRGSVCGIAYHEATPQKGVYIRDVEAGDGVKNRRLKDDSDVRHWGRIDYFPGHTDVKSELALPILADGVRVGVLNLESLLKEAYGEGHIIAAHWYAEKAGRLFGAALERNRRGRGLRPEVIKRIQPEFLAILRELWDIRNANPGRNAPDHTSKADLDCLVFNADYINGKLTARTKHPNNTSDIEVTFGFDTEPAFTCSVFRERSGAFCPDARRAIKQKRIANTYVRELHLAGPLIGFPIYVHGYAAGVVVCWHRDGGDGCVDWRDMELFRRSAHLIANASAKDYMLRPLGDLKQPPELVPGAEADIGDEEKRVRLARSHINGVKEVLELCVQTPLAREPRLTKEKDSSECFYRAWLKVAEKIASLIELLWVRYGAEEKHWLVPTRARLWVASGKANGVVGKGNHPSVPPTFGLVMEVSLDKEKLKAAYAKFFEFTSGGRRSWEQWAICAKEVMPIVKNLFRKKSGIGKETEPAFLTARPERPAGSDEFQKSGKGMGELVLKDFLPGKSSNSLTNEEDRKSAKETVNEPRMVTIEEPNMSFLLSRIWADGFTRFQQTETNNDPLGEWMRKDTSAAVYAAPILRVLSEPQQEEQEAVVLEKNVPRTRRREVAGILVLDSLELSKEAIKPPTDEGHITFQNELLHTVDLFVACLAESQEFQNGFGTPED